MIKGPEHTTHLVLLFGGVTLSAMLLKPALRRLRVPPLVAYLGIGIALRVLDQQTGAVGRAGNEMLGFLAALGVIALLFRVGLRSDLPGLVGQLGCASMIWLGNLAVSGVGGYAAARLLGFPIIPSLVVATAMTATSIGIPARVWQDADALDTEAGQRFVDVAELDDISGVVLMAVLFAVLPALRGAGQDGLWLVLGRKTGLFLLKLVLFAAACVVFSRFLEARFSAVVRRIESGPDPMLVVVAVGVLVAAAAGLLGFSIAIGAFFAGLVFSRDERSSEVDESFSPLYDLLTPFFFVAAGLAMAPDDMLSALGIGAALFAAAVVGKVIGTAGPARCYVDWPEAGTLGVSMIPRAEITLLIMHRAAAMGKGVAPPAIYSGMILVCAATCMTTPPLLRWLLTPKPSADETS
ncbi:MAG: cation:proton antiporter [Planctomycetes bacterium]|jgi:Kef-type K+ transport system membrane component KefB|nr:cation:proton antiporter [Planctomycetota bacterium]